MSGLELTDGSTVACDAALVAVGAEPCCDLAGDPRSGIETDACGRTAIPACTRAATSRPPGARPSAAACVSSTGRPPPARLRPSPTRSSGASGPTTTLPYFWSDQFGLRLQHVGHAEEWDAVELDGGPDSFTARYLDRAGRPLAALAVNRPREVGALRRELALGLEEAA